MLAFSLLAAAGCTSTAPVDLGARAVVNGTAASALTAPTATVADAFAGPPDTALAPAGVALDRDSTLRLATGFSRKLQARRDSLTLKGVDLLAARRDFGPQVAGTLAYLRDGDGSDSAGLDLGVSQILPWGGTLSAAGAADRTRTHVGPGSNDLAYTTSGSLTLDQPLLAGAGREASHEPLTQAERNLVYELRAFALERQDFAIGILRAYYELLLRQNLVDNTRLNVEQNAFLRQRSEALFKVGVVNALDVMRAQQQEFTAQNQLQAAVTDSKAATARFLVELGLPVVTTVTLAGRIPEPASVTLDARACVALARERRLDLRTARDQVEDAARRVRIARRGMLPELDASATARIEGSSPDGFDSPSYANGDDLSAGLVLTLPLDKRPDRYTLKRAQIAEAAARRAAEEKRDTVQVEIEESFRRLQELRTSADIQFKSMEIARRRNEYALLRFKNGEVSNRDVVEAQTELLNARNAHASALVQYELKRIQLLRDVGLLDVNADGTLVETAGLPAPEARP